MNTQYTPRPRQSASDPWRPRTAQRLLLSILGLRDELSQPPAERSTLAMLRPDPKREARMAQLRDELAELGGHIVDALLANEADAVFSALERLEVPRLDHPDDGRDFDIDLDDDDEWYGPPQAGGEIDPADLFLGEGPEMPPDVLEEHKRDFEHTYEPEPDTVFYGMDDEPSFDPDTLRKVQDLAAHFAKTAERAMEVDDVDREVEALFEEMGQDEEDRVDDEVAEELHDEVAEVAEVAEVHDELDEEPATRRTWFNQVSPPPAATSPSPPVARTSTPDPSEGRGADADADADEAEAASTERVPEPAPKPEAQTPASAADLEDFMKKFGANRPSLDATHDSHPQPEAATRTQHSLTTLEKALRDLGPTPRKLKGAKKLREQELATLQRVFRDSEDAWAECRDEVDNLLTNWVSSRLRAVQQAAKVRPSDTSASEYVSFFGSLVAHAKATQHGVVHGLARGHAPLHGSWLADARVYEAQLRDLASTRLGRDRPQRANPDNDIRLLTEAVREKTIDVEAFLVRVNALLEMGVTGSDKRLVNLVRAWPEVPHEDLPTALRRAVEAQLRAEEDGDEEESEESGIAADWAGFGFTRGMRAALIGGDPRPHRREALERAFDFSELEWIDAQNGGSRNLDRLEQQIRNGTVDVVIVLRAFSSHMITDRIFPYRNNDGLLVALADTYGVQQVRLGIERFTGLRSSADDLN